MRSHLLQWAQRWFTFDPRVLGVGRIALGLVCVIDILRRAPHIKMFYCGDQSALLPPSPTGSYSFSLLHYIDAPALVWFFWALSALAAVAFTVGFRTKLSHILTYLCILSWHSNTYPHNGGDFVIHLMLMWTLFVPMGQTYSVDAKRNPSPLKAIWSFVPLAILLQLSVIYFFGAVTKWGHSWTHGTALYYLLHLDIYVTPLGLALRDSLPMAAVEFLTYATLVIEAFAPLFLLAPFYTVILRRFALVALMGFHVGILLLVNVGLFSPVMMASLLFVLTPEDMDWLTRQKTPRPELPNFKLTRRTGAIHAVVALLMVINGMQCLKSNQWSRKRLKAIGIQYDYPSWVRSIWVTGGMRQNWYMFAPNVDGGEGRLVLQAQTQSQETIDPLTGNPPQLGPNEQSMGFNEFSRKYANKVIYDRTGDSARRLAKWAKSQWNENTSPDEHIETVEVWHVFDKSPDPGEDHGPTVLITERLDKLAPK